MRLRSLSLMLVLALSVAACTNNSQKVSYYTMQATASAPINNVETSALAMVIGPVEFPSYLKRKQMVSRENNQLFIDDFHRWGASFEDTVIRTLGENMSILLNTPRIVIHPNSPRYDIDYRIVLDILRFEGARAGDIELHARWTLIDGRTRKTLHVEQTQLKETVANNEYTAMVDAHNALLLALSMEMAAKIKQSGLNITP